MNNAVSASRRNTLFIFLVFSYFFSYFFRVSTSVVLPLIQQEWLLDTTFIAFISSMYFYTYALMQPLCGVLNDRIGPAKVVAAGIILAAAGSFCFALATNPAALIVGRLLMGIGLSPMLSGVLVFQSGYFPPEKYTRLTALTLMVGNMGGVFSVAPLSYALHSKGRSTVFSVLSFVTLFIAVALFYLGRKIDSGKKTDTPPFLNQLFCAARSIKTSKNLLLIILIWLICFGVFMTFQGLWAVSWFAAAYPKSAHGSLAATVAGLGVVAGNLISGGIGKKNPNRSRILRIVVCLNTLLWFFTVASFAFSFPLIITTLITGILGLTSGVCFVQFTAAVNELSPQGQGGAIFGIINALIFFGVIFFQWGSGFLLELCMKTQNSADVFSFLFFILALFTLIACLTCFFLKPFNRPAQK